MTSMKNPLISILFACIFALIITACTPKKTENTESQSHEQRPEGTEIVTNFTSDYSYLHNQDAAPRQVGDFVIQGTELKGYYGSNRNLTIPVDLGVNAIGWSAFSHSSVSSITIPKEILSIHENAFENCHSLQSITVSNDNENYASADGTLFNKQKTDMLYVPHGRSGTFSVPDTITEIREYTFVSRHALTSINIPASVTKIGSGGDVFDGAVRLTSINVDRNNSSYASVDGILYDKAVTTIIHFPQDIQGVISIPNTVTTIGNDVLRRRIGITSFNIPNSVATIGDRAFLECSNLTSINIPGSVKTIGDEAFSACTSLRTVTFNEGLVSIGERAFYNCTAVENINIPASVTRIGTGAFAAHDSENWYYMGGIFSGSSSLASITADQRSQIFSSVDGVLFNKAVTELLHFPQGKGGAYSIPNTVTRIEDFAFSYRNNLTSVTIPASVTSIGTDAFFGCSNLTSISVDLNNRNYASDDGVLFNKAKNELLRFPRGRAGSYTIPNTVVIIGKNAFARASGLTSITIPSSVTTIRDTAFAATGLTTLTLPNSITSIGEGAFTNNYGLEIVNLPDNYYAYDDDGKGGAYFFYGCINLKRFIASRNNKHYSTVDGVLLSKDGKKLIRYPYGRQGPYTIPSTVTSIAYKAFYKAEGLTSITIPNSVKIIGDFAFDGSGITSLNIPNSVTDIGKYAFTRCMKLSSVNIPENVTSIGDFVFYHCTALKQINGDMNNINIFLAVNER